MLGAVVVQNMVLLHVEAGFSLPRLLGVPYWIPSGSGFGSNNRREGLIGALLLPQTWSLLLSGTPGPGL